MKRLRKLDALTWAASLAVVGACGSGDMHDDDNGSAALQSELSAARAEVSLHHQTVLASPSLADVMPETDRHQTAMTDMIGRMGGSMDGMSHCSGSGMTSMHQQMTTMQGELDEHRQAMADAVDLTAARAACTAYADMMNGLLDDMGHSVGAMGCM